MQIVLLRHPVVYNKWPYSRPFITESVLYFCEKLFFFQMEVTGIGRFFSAIFRKQTTILQAAILPCFVVVRLLFIYYNSTTKLYYPTV